MSGPPPIPVSGVSELVLEVSDLGAAERFYAETLGWPVVERWPDRDVIWVMAGTRTRIGLWRPQVGLAGSRGGVHVHFAVKIDDADYDAAAAALRDRGLEVHEEVFGEGRGRAAFVTDPDDHVVELWTWDVAEHLADLPGSDLELAAALVEAYNRRDVERVCELADERCEWWPSIVGAVEGTPYRGHEGIRAHFAEQRQAWDELVLLVDASGLRDVAGRIVMLGQIRGRGHASGLDLSSEYAGVLEASNGRWVRLRSFLDHAAALRFARGDP